MSSLDENLVRLSLQQQTSARLDRLRVFAEIDSTNDWLKDQTAPLAGHINVALAEHQTAGRGRRNRMWISAPGGSLCLSVSYRFQATPENLPPMTLALGVGVVNALADLGVQDLCLKWPNDLLIGNNKLGGILTETQFRNRDEICVVAGIGINVDPPEAIAGGIESDWAHRAIGLRSSMAEPPSREQLAVAIIDAFFSAFTSYDQHGFSYFKDDFVAIDWLAGQSIVVDTPGGDIKGIATGIDKWGGLLVDSDAGRQTIVSGSILQAENIHTENQAPPQ